MSKLSAIFASAVLLPVVGFVSTASAIEAYGSIGGGNIYTSKNVTQNGTFADVTNATCNDVVKLRGYIHNPGPDALVNVKAVATLPTGKATSFSSKMTISASNANPASESDTTSVMSNKEATLNYVTGSAEYFDANGARLGSLSDSIVTTGANVPGGVAVSTLNARYVQFQAKLKCDVPPTMITVCELATKKIISIKETDFDAAKHSKDLNDCAAVEPGNIKVCVVATKEIVTIKENEFDAAKHSKDLNDCVVTPVTTAPKVLAATGPVETFAQIIGVTALAGAISYYIRSRRVNILG